MTQYGTAAGTANAAGVAYEGPRAREAYGRLNHGRGEGGGGSVAAGARR
jgi:hypothetical protein